MSTALNEIGYPKVWIEAQLSHADPNRISASYNHAEYVEQRRLMMQDWADRLDLFEQGKVEAASTHLTIHLQGLPVSTAASEPARAGAPLLLVSPPGSDDGAAASDTVPHRLPAVTLPEYARPQPSPLQLEHQRQLQTFEAPHNLVVADYARLAGKSRRWISHEIQVGNLLAIRLGNKGQRVPDWQLDPLRRDLVQAALQQTPRGIDSWAIYYALLQPRDTLNERSAIAAVTRENMEQVCDLVLQDVIR